MAGQPQPSRREFVYTLGAFVSAALASPWLPGAQPAGSAPTCLILLGTGGGPRPRKTRYATAQVIIANGVPYVVDCGDGVATQLVRAGVALAGLRQVFITHHHSDHNADYGNLLLLAWVSGLKTRVDAWGPPPLEKITRLFFEMSEPDITARLQDEGRIALEPLIHVHELSQSGNVLDDGNVKVTCAVVDHPPVRPSFAYRFDAADRSIVISGDTRRCDALVQLARGADVLVHEALYPGAVDRLVVPVANAATLRKSIVAHHTAVEDAGRVAEAAGVKTLVLSHLVPSEDPLVTDEMWLEAAHRTFHGQVIVGHDLMEI